MNSQVIREISPEYTVHKNTQAHTVTSGQIKHGFVCNMYKIHLQEEKKKK